MPHILHVIPNLDSGGAETALTNLVRFASPGMHHTVVSLSNRTGLRGIELRRLMKEVISPEITKHTPVIAGVDRIKSIVRAAKPDVISSWMYHANVLCALAEPLCRPAKLVWNIRASDLNFHTTHKRLWPVALVQSLLSIVPTSIIANSHAGVRFHKAIGHHPKRWQVIPNGFDTDRFRPNPEARTSLLTELGLPPSSRLIGLIARLNPMKDHSSFLLAAQGLASERPDVHFVLAGRMVSLKEPQFRALVPSGLEGRVHALGERADTERIMAALDLLTLCSLSGEGFPNVVGEAMACGVRCVVTDVGDAADIVGDTGSIVPMRDPAALTAAWGKMLELPATELQSLKFAARERIENLYSLPSVVSQFETAFRELAPCAA